MNIYKIILTPGLHRLASGLQLYHKDGKFISPKNHTQARTLIELNYDFFDINICKEGDVEVGEFFITENTLYTASVAGTGMKVYASTHNNNNLPTVPYGFIRKYSKFRHKKVYVKNFEIPIEIKPINFEANEVREILSDFANFAEVDLTILNDYLAIDSW